MIEPLNISYKRKRVKVINKVNKPKRHHFLPIFYLINFCEKGFLWVYDRNKNEYREQTPINTAIQKKYYSFIGCDGKEHFEIENKVLSDIETETKPIIDKINNKEIISLYEKMILAIFITFLHLRVPSFEKEMNDLLEKFIKIYAKFTVPTEENTKKIIKRFASNNKQKDISPKKLMDFVNKENYKVKVHRDFSLKMMYNLAQELPIDLIQMDWQFCYSPKKSSFVTSDNPFILIPSSNYKKEGVCGLGIRVPGVKKIIPLTQKVCLVIYDKGNNIEKKDIPSREVEEINSYITKNCDRFLISRDKVLLEKLIKITNIDEAKTKSRAKVFQSGNFIIMRKK